MDKSYYKSPKASRLMKLLWNAAGADAHILNKSTYSDHVKYACLGGIVVATGLMAAMAGGYAGTMLPVVLNKIRGESGPLRKFFLRIIELGFGIGVGGTTGAALGWKLLHKKTDSELTQLIKKL